MFDIKNIVKYYNVLEYINYCNSNDLEEITESIKKFLHNDTVDEFLELVKDYDLLAKRCELYNIYTTKLYNHIKVNWDDKGFKIVATSGGESFTTDVVKFGRFFNDGKLNVLHTVEYKNKVLYKVSYNSYKEIVDNMLHFIRLSLDDKYSSSMKLVELSEKEIREIAYVSNDEKFDLIKCDNCGFTHYAKIWYEYEWCGEGCPKCDTYRGTRVSYEDVSKEKLSEICEHLLNAVVSLYDKR